MEPGVGGLELEKGQLGRQIHGSAGEGIQWEGTASSGKMSSDRHICAVAHNTPLYNSACMYVCVCVMYVLYIVMRRNSAVTDMPFVLTLLRDAQTL